MLASMSGAPTLETDLKYWLGFNLVKGFGPAKVRALLDHFGELRSAWHAGEVELQRVGIDQRAVTSLREFRATANLDEELSKVARAGVQLLTWHSADYPRYLLEIADPPPLLYVRGALIEEDQWAVALVGTRRHTAYGRQVTRELVEGLVRNHVTVVSGLARGIDTVAHEAAVKAGGRTIAVLGSGLDRVYPPQNRKLAARIAHEHGAIVSAYGLGVPPEARNFPPRNRIISGLSLGVVVVEAGKRSGALITARYALEQDREVFAVPGSVKSPASKGTNNLIQQGAKLVQTVRDVLEELNLTMVPEQTAVQLALPESTEEALLLAALTHDPVHIDELTRQVELPAAAVSSTLSLMELKGMVLQVGGMNYVLAREPGPVYDSD
ncbi:MAG: DNA-processing protein DprA [Candidatus Promineifilaceae bacterium]|nr:DNA-processing protein DprA [Candidatus Promineifilaceae bacterium]